MLGDIELVEREDRDTGFGRVETYWSITAWGAGYIDGHVNADLVRPLPALRPSYATRPDWWAGFG